MKAKEVHKQLEGLGGNDLYQKARELYELEVDQIIHLRSHGRKPTVSVVEGAVRQVADWFHKVHQGLAWSDEKLPGNIIEWETGEAYVRNNLVNPTLLSWGKRTRGEIAKGTPFPMLEAMRVGDLNAAGAMMMARIGQEAKHYSDILERRKAFAKGYGLRECPYNTEARHCEHQTTYVMELYDGKPLPTSTSDVVFVCALDNCTAKIGVT